MPAHAIDPLVACRWLAAGPDPFFCDNVQPAPRTVRRSWRRIVPVVLLAFASMAGVLVPATPSAAQQPDVMLLDGSDTARYRAGDFVVVLRRSDLKVDAEVVDTVEEGVLLGIDQVNGDWLWVTSKKSGWLHNSSVVPAKEAITFLNAAVSRNPNDPRMYARRGVARALNLDFAGALKDYNEAIRLKPQEALYYGDRGCIHLALGDWQRATDDFQQELKRIDSEDAGKREIRAEWLEERLADAAVAKEAASQAADSAVTLGQPQK